ncbi:MAG: DUF2283 domain-containing protein [Gemmataceae bacterium]|nr:DUF2283 domain-containing protein [Gemmataceae bacterium]
MNNFQPKLDISVDEATGKVRAAYLRIRHGVVRDTREVADGRAFADYDESGCLLGIELLAPCEIEILDSISQEEPEPVRCFLRGSPPRELVLSR